MISRPRFCVPVSPFSCSLWSVAAGNGGADALSKTKLCDQVRALSQEGFQMDVWPHGYAGCLALIVSFLNPRDCIRRKLAGRRDDKFVHLWRFPRRHLGDKRGYLSDADASVLPLLTLHDDTIHVGP